MITEMREGDYYPTGFVAWGDLVSYEWRETFFQPLIRGFSLVRSRPVRRVVERFFTIALPLPWVTSERAWDLDASWIRVGRPILRVFWAWTGEHRRFRCVSYIPPENVRWSGPSQ